MLTQIVTALFAAILGGFVAHLLTAQRDRANARRAKRVDYLIEAYRRLEACAQRRWSKRESVAAAEFQAMFSKLESALADIQLFGSASQVKLAQEFARQFAERREATFDDLLQDLRRDLRGELSLEEVPRGILHIRFHSDA